MGSNNPITDGIEPRLEDFDIEDIEEFVFI
jgi:hypothetical protein